MSVLLALQINALNLVLNFVILAFKNEENFTGIDRNMIFVDINKSASGLGYGNYYNNYTNIYNK